MAREIWAADAETDPFKFGRIPEPFIWGLTNGTDYFEFEKTEEFVAHVREQNIIVYAHNGGKFDWHFITDYIEDYEDLTVINGRLAKFRIGDCEFRDSYNIIPAPLSAYKKDEIDYSLFEKDKRAEHMPEIKAYLKSDCFYLHEMITAFIETYGMHLTQAGAAMKTWMKMSGEKKPKTSSHYYDELSPYYYGGRTQCFKKGEIKDPFEVIDIVSAYPRAMLELHPWGSEYSVETSLDGLSDDEISRTLIKLEALSTGAFPHRTVDGLSFPADNLLRTFTISGWEYLAARDTETLKYASVKEVCIWNDTIEFGDYIRHFFALKDAAKLSGDEAGYLFAKLFLNSLYGKFASNPENYEEFMTVPADMIDCADIADGWKFCTLLDENTAVVARPLPEEKHHYYNVAVAASITGYVRAFLWRAICQTNGTMLYCDTDSIAAHDISAIPLGEELGQWEPECSCVYAAIAGKKLYAFERKEGTAAYIKKGKYKTASKGVRLNASQIIRIAKGEELTHQNEAPTFTIKGKTVFQERRIRML